MENEYYVIVDINGNEYKINSEIITYDFEIYEE